MLMGIVSGMGIERRGLIVEEQAGPRTRFWLWVSGRRAELLELISRH